MFSKILNFIRQVVRKILPYRDIETVERVETPLSDEMANALDNWYEMYLNRAWWLSEEVKSLNLPAFISSEIARQIVLVLSGPANGRKKLRDDIAVWRLSDVLAVGPPTEIVGSLYLGVRTRKARHVRRKERLGGRIGDCVRVDFFVVGVEAVHPVLQGIGRQ